MKAPVLEIRDSISEGVLLTNGLIVMQDYCGTECNGIINGRKKNVQNDMKE